jgi:hypothetical protein
MRFKLGEILVHRTDPRLTTKILSKSRDTGEWCCRDFFDGLPRSKCIRSEAMIDLHFERP